MWGLGALLITPQGLDKREMFGDQTPSDIVWWPNMLILKWVAKRLKHVWSNTDQTIDTSRWASVIRMPASNMFDTRLSKRTKHRPSNTRTKEMFLIERLMAFKFYQTRSKCTKQGVQTVKCLVTKQCLMVFGRQTFPFCPGPYALRICCLCLFSWIRYL